ncbi:vacuolar-processing enzyme [Tanacetum coccineum]
MGADFPSHWSKEREPTTRINFNKNGEHTSRSNNIDEDGWTWVIGRCLPCLPTSENWWAKRGEHHRVYDYNGIHVTPSNVYVVLLGDKSLVKGGSGKVVDSKPEDRIFIFFSGHGALGSLEMPNAGRIFSPGLLNVLEKKHLHGSYKSMVNDVCFGDRFKYSLDGG